MGRECAFPDAGLCLFHFPLRDCAAAVFVVYYKLVCLAQARAAAITLDMISIGENRYAV